MARPLTDRQAMLLGNAAFNGHLKVPARSHYRRAADALARRGLLLFQHSNGFIAFFDITDAGRAEHERRAAKRELVPVGEVVDGEVVDETCSCGKPGRLMVDPYDKDVNNGHSMVVLCDACEHEACLDI